MNQIIHYSMPLHPLKSNSGGEGRERIPCTPNVHCTTKVFSFANVSTFFASRFLVMHHCSIFLIDILYKKITKAEEQNYGKLKYLWRHPVYEPKMNTIVSLPIFCTRPSQWDFIVTGCNLLIRFSAGVKVSNYSFSSLTWKQKRKIWPNAPCFLLDF